MEAVHEAIKELLNMKGKEENNENLQNQFFQLIFENFEQAINIKDLYKIPFETIKHISKGYFNYLTTIEVKTQNQSENIISSITKFIENISLNYQKESPLIIPYINRNKELSLNLEEIITILSSFHQISIFSTLKEEFIEVDRNVDIDWEYELSKKDEEIKKLKTKIEETQINQKNNLPEKPENFNSNIFVASMYGDLSSIKYLIEVMHEDIDQCDQSQSSPLIYASMNDHLDIVKYLVEKGGNVELENVYGNTAIICSAKFGNINIAKYLMSKGANLYHANKDGKSVLDYLSSQDLKVQN